VNIGFQITDEISEMPDLLKLKIYTERLIEIGNEGAKYAADALSGMIFEDVTIDVSDVYILPPQQVEGIYDRHDQSTVGVFMELGGEAGCDFLLTFEEGEGREIVTNMSREDSPRAMDRNAVDAALTELGNIVIGAFINAISDDLSLILIPTPPNLIADFFNSIIDRFLIKQSMMTDLSIIFVTTFTRGEREVNGALIIFAGKELLDHIIPK